MSDTMPTSATGADPSQVGNPPVTTQPSATSAEPGAQPAISDAAPAPGTSAPTPAVQPTADQAFESLMQEAVATPPDNPQPSPTPPPAATEPPATGQPTSQQPPATGQPAEPPASTSQPSDTPADDGADLEPNATEQQAKAVPLEKLSRALTKRREAIDRATRLEQELAQEQKLVDQMLNRLEASGITQDQLPVFLTALGKHREDPQAQAQILSLLGIQIPQPTAAPATPPPPAAPPIPATQPKPQVDLAELKRRLDNLDLAGAQELLEQVEKPQPAAQPVTTPPPPAAPLQPPVAHPPASERANTARTPQPNPDPGQVLIRSTVAGLGNSLRATYGDAEAKRLSVLVDQEVNARLNQLQALKVRITPESVAEVYTQAHGTVVKQAQLRPTQTPRVPVPTPFTRPADPPPAQNKTADEQFDELVKGRG